MKKTQLQTCATEELMRILVSVVTSPIQAPKCSPPSPGNSVSGAESVSTSVIASQRTRIEDDPSSVSFGMEWNGCAKTILKLKRMKRNP